MIIMLVNETHHVLTSKTTNREITVGRLLHHSDGTHWRLEEVRWESHTLVVTRHTQCGRVKRAYSPEAFHCELRMSTELYVDKQRMETLTKFLIIQTILLLAGAFIAWELPHLIGA